MCDANFPVAEPVRPLLQKMDMVERELLAQLRELRVTTSPSLWLGDRRSARKPLKLSLAWMVLAAAVVAVVMLELR